MTNHESIKRWRFGYPMFMIATFVANRLVWLFSLFPVQAAVGKVPQAPAAEDILAAIVQIKSDIQAALPRNQASSLAKKLNNAAIAVTSVKHRREQRKEKQATPMPCKDSCKIGISGRFVVATAFIPLLG